MQITKELEAELIMVMNDYWDSYIRGDLEVWASYLPDNYWNIGTNEEEIWTSKQEIVDFTRKVLEQFVGMIQVKDKHYSFMPAEPYTMVHEFGNLYVKTDKGWTFYSKMRLSSLMYKTGNGWKILHQHGSYPDNRLENGEFFGFENLLKENTELRAAVKRRTIELEIKNRELEIEAAVERVRAQSLAMYETHDLAKVNQELFNQVTKLNIEGFTGVAIYLVDEEEVVTVWDLSSPGSMSDVNSHAFKYDSKKYPIMGEFVPIWRAADQEYFVLDYPGERMLRAADEMEQVYPPMAELVRTAVNSGALQHQWNAAGRLFNGMLSLDLMKAPTEEVKSITLKMASAFNLAYQRFLDLQKAEAQLQENQIQLALERVRAKTMAMHQSSELADTASILFKQIKELGFETWSCGFCIWKDEFIVESWMGADSGGLLPSLTIPYKEEQTHHEIYKAAQAGYITYDHIWEGKELDAHYDFLATIPSVKQALDMMTAAGLTLPAKQCYYVGFFNKGYLLLITKEPNPQLKDISQRFAQVFDLTYTRFLDLQKAEAQAREAQIELALERVRVGSIAMHKSEELANLSLELVKQVQELGVATWFCAFNIYDDDPRGSLEWGSNGQGTFPQFRTPRESIFLRYYEAGQRGETFLVNPIGEGECATHYEYLCSLPIVGETLLQMKDAGIPFPVSQIDHVAFFKYGYLLFITFEPAPEAHDIFKRFAKVFEQTYTRFLDLQKAEARSREASIEVSLERVRSKTMSMQHSNELLDAATLLFKQIESLGAPVWNCSFNIWAEDKKEATAWNGTKDGFGRPFNTPSSQDVFLDFYNAAQQGDEYYVKEMGGKDLELHYEYLATLPGVGVTIRELKEAGISLPTFQVFNITYFAQGYLMFITYKPVPEFADIFKRFAKVFEQTYTRFLDLQKAEAQTARAQKDLIEIKEARKKAEDTLTELIVTQKQLIQSEKMASLGELTAGIAHEIQNPLNFVNNFSELSNELMDEMKDEITKGDFAEARRIADDIKQNLEKISHHGKRADAIVKGMLQHSQSGKGQKEPTDINALADEYLRLAYHGFRAKDKTFNATLKTDFDKTILFIDIIPQDIGRVILNLITNAFYVVGQKKKTFGNETGYEPVVEVSTKKIADKIVIGVKDNGNGITSDIINKIFQPFFTTKPTGQGTGLGLSLAYDIVKAHGGEITLDTIENEGTTFTIQLPTAGHHEL